MGMCLGQLKELAQAHRAEGGEADFNVITP